MGSPGISLFQNILQTATWKGQLRLLIYISGLETTLAITHLMINPCHNAPTKPLSTPDLKIPRTDIYLSRWWVLLMNSP